MGIHFDSLVAWFGVSLAVLAITLITSYRFSKRTREFTQNLKQLAENSSNDIQKIIARELSPSIHLHDGAISVAKRAANIILGVAQDTNSGEKRITFYGAASIAAMPDSDHTEDSPGSPSNPSTIYRDAVNEAIRKRVAMRRYISLFTETQLRERSISIQSQYVEWLRHQLKLLRADEQYELCNVVRAPQWGSNMARIITQKTVMEITGNGKAAIVITDEHIAQRIRGYARDAIIGKNPRNKIISYSQAPDATNSINDFEHYVGEIEAAHREEKKLDEIKQLDETDAALASPNGDSDGSGATL